LVENHEVDLSWRTAATCGADDPDHQISAELAKIDELA